MTITKIAKNRCYVPWSLSSNDDMDEIIKHYRSMGYKYVLIEEDNDCNAIYTALKRRCDAFKKAKLYCCRIYDLECDHMECIGK